MTTDNSKFDVKKHFDADFSNVYDDEIRKVIPGYEAMHDMAHSLLRHLLPENAELLIIGAGTGQELLRYTESNPGWMLTGVDPVETMLSLARRRIDDNDLNDKVHLHNGYVSELDDSTKYNAATSILVMHFIPDDGSKEEFLQGIAKRLKQGGYIILVDLYGENKTSCFELMFSTWKQRQLDIANDREKVEEKFSQIRKEINYIPEERTFQLLSQAGFSNVMNFYRAFLFGGWVAQKG